MCGDPDLRTPNPVDTQLVNHTENVFVGDFPEMDVINAVVDSYLLSGLELTSNGGVDWYWLIDGHSLWVHLYLFPIVCH